LSAFAAFWAGSRTAPPGSRPWRRDLAAGGIALGAGLLFGLAAVNLPMEGEIANDRLRGVAMLVLALVVPMVASYALGRGDRLPGFAPALDPSRWRRSKLVEVVTAALLAATMVATIHVALGLVFDPRYKDFPVAALLGPVVALAIVALCGNQELSRPGNAEHAAAAVLTGSAVFITLNEGIANWQALAFAGLLLLLALTALRAKAAPD
jgi:glucan 1,3-beta-glucosidase